MKTKTIKSLAIITLLLAVFTSCEDFLNRPTEDSYNIDSFYQTDEQCFQSVNPIYNSPWYDFQRGFVKIGDVLSGNVYLRIDNEYQSFVLKSSNEDLRSASASLWSVNAYCNGIIENMDIKAGPNVSEKTKNTVKGEAYTWKAMTYFFLVRCFGAVPIIHKNSELISSNTYNDVYKNNVEDVYTYIVKTLERAIELLPAENAPGRIDLYGAYGLLAKVYLAKAGLGQSGTRNQADLDQAKYYAGLVVNESGRNLMTNYEDIFRLQNNINEESLIAWRWTVNPTQWTSQNSLQSDLALSNFSEWADTWGTWTGLTIDLQQAFGEDASSLTRNNNDVRRKATMMMQGDHYDYFWADKGGFTYDWTNAEATGVIYDSGTGSNCVKNIVGDNYDHITGTGGMAMDRMATALATHLLRLADVYLIYAEAVLGNSSTTSDALALNAFNAVRGRSVKNYILKTSITFDDIFKERRLELACEGDFWFDFVRLSYYKPDDAKARLANQERGYWESLKAFYKGELSDMTLLKIGSWKVNASDIEFVIPFPDTDLAMNPHLGEAPVPFDFSSIGY